MGFFDNKRKIDVAAAAALKETGGRNEFRHPFKYDISAARSRTPPTKKLFASGEKDESGVFELFDKLERTGCPVRFAWNRFHIVEEKQELFFNTFSRPFGYTNTCAYKTL
jgi:ketosteroid isomerase-like protein